MEILAVLFVILGALALVFAGALWSGYVLSILWSWFMAPIFSLPMLSIPQAIGVALVIGYLTKQSKSNLKKDENHESYKDWVEMLLSPAAALLVGWIVKQFL